MGIVNSVGPVEVFGMVGSRGVIGVMISGSSVGLGEGFLAGVG